MSSINAAADAAFWAFEKEARSFMQDVTKMALIAGGERLLYRSPIGMPSTWKRQPPYLKGYIPGHFINNWQLGVDLRPTGIIPGSDTSGEGSRRRMRMAIPRWPLGPTYYFVNNTPYASALENGHSAQCPPRGMVSLLEMEWQSIVDECSVRYMAGERPGTKSGL